MSDNALRGQTKFKLLGHNLKLNKAALQMPIQAFFRINSLYVLSGNYLILFSQYFNERINDLTVI